MKRKYILFGIPFSLACLFLAKICPAIAEYVFARIIFKIISIPIGMITSCLPFSLAEYILYLLPLILFIMIFRLIYRMRRSKQKKKIFLCWGFHCGVVISILFPMFTFLCGINYYRYEFETYCDFEVQQYSVDELYELCVYLAERVNETKQEVTSVDENQVVRLDDFSEMVEDAKIAYEKLAETYPVLSCYTGTIKPIRASHLMAYTGIVGIYSPFTVEANVNTDIADYNRPADACHELAHLCGFMRENEANFIAYLVCTESDKPYFQYSGYMMALIYATNALYDESVEKYSDISSRLSNSVKADLRYENAYWDSLRSTDAYETVEAVSDKVNDTYLKINGQSDGVKSYGKMVDLLIADYLAG